MRHYSNSGGDGIKNKERFTIWDYFSERKEPHEIIQRIKYILDMYSCFSPRVTVQGIAETIYYKVIKNDRKWKMNSRERTSGQCGICDGDRFQLPNGVWVCPMFYASPMHNQWRQEYDEEGNIVKEWDVIAREGLESYADCSLEEYLEARKNYYKNKKHRPTTTCTHGPINTYTKTVPLTVPLKEYKSLYERVNWFLGWLMQQEEDLGGFIINEWFRGDPPCTGSRARKIIREAERNEKTKD